MEFRIAHQSGARLLGVSYSLHLKDRRLSRTASQSNLLLSRLQEKGFTTLYGELLRATDEHLSIIPFRPRIENSGCEVVKCGDNAEWLLLWEVRKRGTWDDLEEIDRHSGSPLDVIHMVAEDSHPSLDRSSIAELFEIPIDDCTLGLWEQHWNIERVDGRRFTQNKRGQVLSDAEKRRSVAEQISNSDDTTKIDNGFELELRVAEALHSAGLWFRSGVETPFGELDALVAILDAIVLIECKSTTSIGVKDVQVLVSRAASIGAKYAFLFTTMNIDDLHGNVREALEQFRRSGPVYVMALFIRDVEKDIPTLVARICDIIGFDMLYHWIGTDESHYQRSPLWRIDNEGKVNGLDTSQLSALLSANVPYTDR